MSLIYCILADVKHHGEFEHRFQSILKEIESSIGGIILFIKDIHLIIDAEAFGGKNKRNILKKRFKDIVLLGIINATSLLKLMQGMILLIGLIVLKKFSFKLEINFIILLVQLRWINIKNVWKKIQYLEDVLNQL